ncbi:MAG TPA: NADAR family protein [Candidatus Saccharimonadia bacterium]|nr:NADAR family protein [Candidatus Saccharimonadia bacterium]
MSSTTTDHSVRSREALVDALRKGWRPKWLFFWGHQPTGNGVLTSTCFSQWWEAHAFAVDGVLYPTAEHYMMAEKARLFGDEGALKSILNAKSPASAKALGRKVARFDEQVWRSARWDIVVRGNLAKFGEHTDLRVFLLNTGDKVVVEASPFDRIWGIGMMAKDAAAENPQNWKGLNLLGFALMEVRERLRLVS